MPTQTAAQQALAALSGADRKARREAKNMSLLQMAAASQTSITTLKTWELGVLPSAAKADAYAAALGLAVEANAS